MKEDNKKLILLSLDLAIDLLECLSKFNSDDNKPPSDRDNQAYNLKVRLIKELKELK